MQPSANPLSTSWNIGRYRRGAATPRQLSNTATARIGQPVPPTSFSGKPM